MATCFWCGLKTIVVKFCLYNFLSYISMRLSPIVFLSDHEGFLLFPHVAESVLFCRFLDWYKCHASCRDV